MSFKVVYSKPKRLLNIFEAVNSVLDQGNIAITQEFLEISGMDDGHIAFVYLMLDKDEFDEYKLEGKDLCIGVDIKHFIKLLKVSNENDKVTIEYETKHEDLLNLYLEGNGLNKRFSMNLLDISNDTLSIPDMDYDLELTINPKLYQNVMDSISVIGADQIEFNVDGNIRLKGRGDMSSIDLEFDKEYKGEKKFKIVKNSDEKKIIKVPPLYKVNASKGKFNLSFGTTYLKMITKANNLVNEININLTNNQPIRFDFMINEDNGSIINYYIAPKISD